MIARTTLAVLLLAAGGARAAVLSETNYDGIGRPPAGPVTDRGYGGLYTADARCIREDLRAWPTRSFSKFGEAAGDCGLVVPDLTNDHELQFDARVVGMPYVLSAKGADGLDNWAVCRMGPDASVDQHPYHCQWLGVRSAPADRAAVTATLPHRARGAG